MGVPPTQTYGFILSCIRRGRKWGRPEGRPREYYGQSAATADEPLEMQVEALLSELPMVLPSVTAAIAIAPPTIARIRAYSAAEAPDSSLIIRMKVIVTFLPLYAAPRRDAAAILGFRLRAVSCNSRRTLGNAGRRLVEAVADGLAERHRRDRNRAAD